MSNSSLFIAEPPHVVLLPTLGMSYLSTFLRLAAMLASQNCMVTLIVPQPITCPHESTQISSFFSYYQNIKRLDFQMLECDNYTTDDPFIAKFEVIDRSVHLLSRLLSSLPQPVSAIFSGFTVAASLGQLAAELGIPNYIVSTISACSFSTVAYLPLLRSDNPSKCHGSSSNLEIPGLVPLPKSIIPSPWLDDLPSDHLVRAYLVPNAQSLPKAKGIILNSFSWFEPETIAALNGGRVLSNLPPLFPVGPLEPYDLEKDLNLPWLDDQPANSVVYVNFGNKAPLSKDQVKELGYGLERSGVAFLWVLKANKIDEKENEKIRELLGDSFLERTKNNGIIMKRWVNQQAILAHPAIGGFINPCEDWDSVMDAARHGVPMLVWPQQGSQGINAKVVENAELGMWMTDGCCGGERVLKGKEIGDRVMEFMGNEELRIKAQKVKEKAVKACEAGGSSEKFLMGLIKVLLQQKDDHQL